MAVCGVLRALFGENLPKNVDLNAKKQLSGAPKKAHRILFSRKKLAKKLLNFNIFSSERKKCEELYALRGFRVFRDIRRK